MDRRFLAQERTAWSREGRGHLSPIVPGPEMVLVPLRLRRPRSRDEGGTGYVVGSMDTLALRLAERERDLERRRESLCELSARALTRRTKDNCYLAVEPGGGTVNARLVDRGGDIIIRRREKDDSPL